MWVGRGLGGVARRARGGRGRELWRFVLTPRKRTLTHARPLPRLRCHTHTHRWGRSTARRPSPLARWPTASGCPRRPRPSRCARPPARVAWERVCVSVRRGGGGLLHLREANGVFKGVGLCSHWTKPIDCGDAGRQMSCLPSPAPTPRPPTRPRAQLTLTGEPRGPYCRNLDDPPPEQQQPKA